MEGKAVVLGGWSGGVGDRGRRREEGGDCGIVEEGNKKRRGIEGEEGTRSWVLEIVGGGVLNRGDTATTVKILQSSNSNTATTTTTNNVCAPT